jgi:phosphatidylglycerol---prolipoprotein diacylglyceryl transferase
MRPVLFRLGGLTVYAYGFFLAMGIVAGALLAFVEARREGIPIERMIDLFFYSVISAVVGARLLFVIINFDSYRNNPLHVFRVWEGGLVFYGGLVLAAGVSIGYMRRRRLAVWKMADLFAPSVALGLFFGRVGCFFAGCCYGKETTLPWAVTFTDPASLALRNLPLHPTQLYDAGNGLAIFFFLIWLKRRKTFDGEVFWLFLSLYSVTRFFIEIMRGDPRGFLWDGFLSTSQFVGTVLAIVSLFMLFYLGKREAGPIQKK